MAESVMENSPTHDTNVTTTFSSGFNSISIPSPSPPNFYNSSSDHALLGNPISDLRIFIDGDGDGDFDLTLDSVDDLYFLSENESFVIPVDSTNREISGEFTPVTEIAGDCFRESDNCVSDVSEATIASSPSSESAKMVMGQKLKSEEEVITKKRKKEIGEDESRNNKYRRWNHEDDDEKRNVRLIRNRESAHLSRQRKKHYVEDLEEKVKKMESMIMDLNSKVSYFMAENATLRQRVGPGSGMCPLVPMAYHPWLHCPGYMVKPQGYSQVPLLPIPRLKPQQSLAKVVKRKMTKKVASVSVLGLLFCLFLFGALVYDQSRGRILDENTYSNRDFVPMGNGSESLVASLFVPRNEKLVKIDGNLIIRSVLASEEGRVAANKDLSLALPLPDFRRTGDMSKHLYSEKREPRSSSRADDTSKDQLKGTRAYGEMQQWFREGVAGQMFSSGMCTEVFQFDVTSTSGAIPKSIVVSVLVDSREGGDGDIDGLTGGTKSLSRVFIVLLEDGVKYVTYSCVLPQPEVPHIVTT